jgi:vanillin dehydrogenase
MSQANDQAMRELCWVAGWQALGHILGKGRMLEVAGLSVRYGKHLALADAGFCVRRGEIVVLLGANGAGKSSCLRALGGLVAPAPGARVLLDGVELAQLASHEIVERGLVLVPEDRGIFAELDVRENLALGAYTRRARPKEAASLAKVLALFPRLAERQRQIVRTMSGGEQQMVGIGRALMSDPLVLLLDEPSLGLAPLVCQELFATLARIRALGVGILLVEQNARQSLAIADRGYLMENGRIVGEGSAADLKSEPSVAQAYLGGALVARAPSASRASRLAAPAGRAGNESEIDARFAPASGPPKAPQPGSAPMFDVPLLIANDDRKAASGVSFDRLNPLTGAIASRAAAACAEDVASAAAAAAAAFPAWSETGPAARRALLNKAADLLEGRSAEFAALMGAETGATAMWAGFNCMLGAGMLREAAAMTSQIAGEVIPSNVPGSFAMGYRQPVGVVLGIAPWNAPVILGVRAIAMPLACGNSVILKASETCPGTHRLIGSVLREAGFPAGVVNVLMNAPSDAGRVVEALIAHPAVRRVNFTGSTKVGKIIAKICAEHLKPVLLELGGKSPLLVLEDADLEAAVAAAAFGAFANQGQICMSTERIVVDQKIADVFVERFAAKAKSLSVGDPREGNAVLGSLVDRSAAERVTSLVLDAVAKGARLVSGGSVNGTLINAHVLDHVTCAMRVYHEETFGPVAVVVRAKDEEEAVRIANDTPYGLSAAVFGRDVNRAFRVARRLETGICHINGPTVHDEAQMPFGGVKGSGYGRFGGKAAIAEFTELRWITIQSGDRHYPF